MSDDSRLRLKRHCSVVAHSPDVVELRHGAWNANSFTVADEHAAGKLLGIVNRLDGTLTLREIAAAEDVPKSQVETVVNQLGELGLLEEGPTHALDHYLDQVIPALAPYGGSGQGSCTSTVLFGDERIASEIERLLRASAPSIEYEVIDDGSPLRSALARAATTSSGDGLALEEDTEAFAAWRGRFAILATSTFNPLERQAFNVVSLRHRIPWISATVDGPFLLLGPTFIPWRSPCYVCLETRVLMNLREAASYVAYKRMLAEGRVAQATRPLDLVLEAMLASLTAFEALNFLLTGASFTVGKILAIYLPTMEFTFNEVLRLPGCSACGPSPEADDSELYFELRSVLDGDPSQLRGA